MRYPVRDMRIKEGLLSQAGKVILVLLFLAGFFYFGESCWAVEHIIINEVQIYPTENRFIELYNPNDFSVDLTNWYLQRKTQSGASFGSLVSKTYFEGKTISANSYFLISRTSMANADIVLAGLTLTESNTIQLKDSNGEIIDKVEWGLPPEDGKSLERKDNGSWETSQNVGGTPRAVNSGGSVAPPPPPPTDYQGGETATSTSTDLTPSPSPSQERGAKLGDAVINEFVSDPADEDVEWIELYNATSEEIDLTGWTIEEGSGAKTSLSGVLGGSEKEKFFVVEKPKGSLNNAGDIIILRDNSGALIDQVAYGNWNDGNLANNAPVVADPDSLARKFDGQNSFNNLNDFAITTTPTKGTSNIVETHDYASGNETNNNSSPDLIISEIFPDPVGSDTEKEFIEIYNKGEKEINILNWEIGDDSKLKYKFKENLFIKSGEYFALFRKESKIALNNGGDKVRLYPPLAENAQEEIIYEESKEGFSYNYSTSTEKWIWSEVVTPNKANVIKIADHSPIVAFSCPGEAVVGQSIFFDSSDTIDENQDELKYDWDFGDGIKLNLASPAHTYLKEGNYLVKLTVSDGKNKVEKEKIIKIVSSSPPSGKNPLSIIINEILPDPAGNDAEEWIELKNIGVDRVNLFGWKLDDIEGGSAPYKINVDSWIESGGFYLVERNESGLALNNSNESVRLFDASGKLVDSVNYEKSFSGESFARAENKKWFWTTVITPGEENTISVAGSQESKTMASVAGVKISTKANGEYAPMTLEKIRESEIGDLVKVKGTVAVEPGILGTQYFYIVGSPGVQVYNYKKDFPDLKVGDYIEVSGEISEINGEKRIKTKQKGDIVKIESRPVPSPENIMADKITEEYLGCLVSITGEITDRKASDVYLDDGTDEARVYIKQNTGIDLKSIIEGEIVMITGILSQTASGLKIMPRSPEDIIRKGEKDGGDSGQVLGEVAESSEWSLVERDKRQELFKYLLILAGGMILALGGLLIRETKRKL